MSVMPFEYVVRFEQVDIGSVGQVGGKNAQRRR